MDAARLYRGPDPRRRGAERCGGQSRGDRTDPFFAVRHGDAGLGRSAGRGGLFSAFYGVAIGLTQDNPKTVLAYSSVSQMGLLAAALGMGWAAGNSGAVTSVSFAAAHHVLVKGALFFAIGVAAASRPRLWPVLLPAAVLALGLGGLPLTGGALAKLALKPELGKGFAGALAALAAAGSILLMLHFLRRLAALPRRVPASAAPARLSSLWLVAAFASLALPWLLFPLAGTGQREDSLAPLALWAGVWPVLAGAAIGAGLQRSGWRQPRMPPGNIVVAGEAAFRAAAKGADAVERLDQTLRRWPVACLSLVVLAVLLAAALWAQR